MSFSPLTSLINDQNNPLIASLLADCSEADRTNHFVKLVFSTCFLVTRALTCLIGFCLITLVLISFPTFPGTRETEHAAGGIFAPNKSSKLDVILVKTDACAVSSALLLSGRWISMCVCGVRFCTQFLFISAQVQRDDVNCSKCRVSLSFRCCSSYCSCGVVDIFTSCLFISKSNKSTLKSNHVRLRCVCGGKRLVWTFPGRCGSNIKEPNYLLYVVNIAQQQCTCHPDGANKERERERPVL